MTGCKLVCSGTGNHWLKEGRESTLGHAGNGPGRVRELCKLAPATKAKSSSFRGLGPRCVLPSASFVEEVRRGRGICVQTGENIFICVQKYHAGPQSFHLCFKMLNLTVALLQQSQRFPLLAFLSQTYPASSSAPQTAALVPSCASLGCNRCGCSGCIRCGGASVRRRQRPDLV